jgi:multidrug resistance efflux pump
MIIFLTLCYVGVLALLVKLKVITLTLWWKISPAVWFVLLLIVLFIPMQWGAPAGAVTLFQDVVEIVPNVSGEVIEVSARPLTPMKKGDVLFKIDPRPFQYTVDRLTAALSEAQKDIPQLKAALDSAKAAVTRATAERARAKREYERNLTLQEQGAAPEREVVRWRTAYETAQAAIRSAEASEERARLAYESDTTVARIRADLNGAQFDLEQTTVTAPADGFVIGLTLRPGQRVTNLPVRSWVAYVYQDQTHLFVGINHNLLRHVKPGQRAEIVFKLYPGKIFGATVFSIAYMTPQGQVQPSGLVPMAPTAGQLPAPYGVRLELDEELRELVPGGAVGSAAIYTDSVKATHLIRRIMMRMQAWLNYIVPW